MIKWFLLFVNCGSFLTQTCFSYNTCSLKSGTGTLLPYCSQEGPCFMKTAVTMTRNCVMPSAEVENCNYQATTGGKDLLLTNQTNKSFLNAKILQNVDKREGIWIDNIFLFFKIKLFVMKKNIKSRQSRAGLFLPCAPTTDFWTIYLQIPARVRLLRSLPAPCTQVTSRFQYISWWTLLHLTWIIIFNSIYQVGVQFKRLSPFNNLYIHFIL